MDYVRRCFAPNGGVANWPGATDYLETTFFAAIILSFLDATEHFTDATLRYVLGKEHAEGGFGESREGLPNLFNTFYAVICLAVTDALERSVRERCSSYLAKYISHADGVYDAHHPGMTTTAAYWALLTARCLMLELPFAKETLTKFCLSTYVPAEGLFAPAPGGIVTLQNTYEVLTILKELSALSLVDHESVQRAILKRKQGLEYFDDLFRRPTKSSAMWAIGSLGILDSLVAVENAEVLHSASKAGEEITSLYDLFCDVNIMVNLAYEYGRVKLGNTVTVTEDRNTDISRLQEEEAVLQINGLDASCHDFRGILQSYRCELDPKNGFLQVVIAPHHSRIHEIEHLGSGYVALRKAVARVGNECIARKTLDRRKLKVLGVLNPQEDLVLSETEGDILQQHCATNHFLSYRVLVGKQASCQAVLGSLSEGNHVTLYSGHSAQGALKLTDGDLRLRLFLETLVRNKCSILILNCCDTYDHVKDFFLAEPHLSEVLNVLCALTQVEDAEAMHFVVEFLRFTELGFPISEAVRCARSSVYVKSGGLGRTWWSYVLFGNPYTIIE